MKKVLFLLLLSSAFAGRASADGLAATCGISPANVITDGQFQAAVGSCAGYLLGTEILIDRPAGIEILWGMGDVDTDRAFYLNNKGEVVFSYEEPGDRAALVAAYTGPGVQEIPAAKAVAMAAAATCPLRLSQPIVQPSEWMPAPCSMTLVNLVEWKPDLACLLPAAYDGIIPAWF